VHAEESRWKLALSGDNRNGQRGGIGRHGRRLGDAGLELIKEFALYGDVFSDRFNDERRGTQFAHVVGEDDSLPPFFSKRSWKIRIRDKFSHRLIDVRFGLVPQLGLAVECDHSLTVGRQAGDDPAAEKT
jgi:hypothetical protein